jgi:magnesium chelatase family protein
MNPHRGGYSERGHEVRDMLEQYRKKISGPIMDRIDLWLSVSQVPYEDLVRGRERPIGDETKRARDAVLRARECQARRFGARKQTNAGMTARDIETHVPLSESVAQLLAESARKLHLSPRGYHRLIKVARTIADLEGSKHVEVPHVLEALQYRAKL